MTKVLRVHRLSAFAVLLAVGGFGCVGGNGHVDNQCIQCSDFCVDCDGNGCFFCQGGSSGTSGGSGTSGTSGTGGFSGFSGDDGGGVALPWTSPFTNTGDNGTWRNTSEDVLCLGAMSLDSLSVWSDTRGVYVVGGGVFLEETFAKKAKGFTAKQLPADVPGAAPPPMDAGFGGGFAGAGGVGGSAGFGGAGGTAGFGDADAGSSFGDCTDGFGQCSGRVIYFNDGARGWRQQYREEGWQNPAGLQLSGLPSAELVLRRTMDSFEDLCSLTMVDGSTGRCEHTNAGVSGFFAVDSQLAYASIGNNLLVYDGSAWSVYPTPLAFTPIALWANATDVVAVGDLGRIARLRDGVWTSQNRSIQRLTAVWGGVGEELWVGTGAGDILYRDESGTWGATTHLGGVTCSTSDPIAGLWGADGTVYVQTERAIARWSEGSLNSLANWSCGFTDPFFGFNGQRMRGIWGNGANELFIAITDDTRFADRFSDVCGNGFVVYFDGTTFHRL